MAGPAAVAAGLALTVSLGTAPPAALAAASPVGAAGPAAQAGAVTELTSLPDAVTVPSATDARATMGSDVMLHWNGATWAKVTISSAGGGGAGLDSVSGASPTDVWAVGSIFVKAFTSAALTVHWNGKHWTRVATPSLPAENQLTGVSATSASDAWAVGYHLSKAGVFSNLILRRNGASWTQVASPPPASGPGLNAVTSISPSLAFAVGTYAPPKGTTTEATTLLQWNGTTWTQVPTPNPGTSGGVGSELDGVAASSRSNAWAVGEYSVGLPPGNVWRTLMLHWNGTNWTRA